jgi:hypothetical protein
MSELSKKAIGALAELDPIFGLVAAHKAAWAQFIELGSGPIKLLA